MDLRKINLYLLFGFYFVAGLNHFINPEFYYPLIPDYLPFVKAINIASGLIEMALALSLLVPRTRKWASNLIIFMLIAFIPSHVYFIQIGSCVEGGLCVSEWIGWIRLLVIHPILIIWAWSARLLKNEN